LERAVGVKLDDRFWLVLHEPGCVPERKGPWRLTEQRRVLREFMRARPTALIDFVTIGSDGPQVQRGPECLQMLDGRSMAFARRHNASVRAAFAPLPARAPLNAPTGLKRNQKP
jgi:hypothetical protein